MNVISGCPEVNNTEDFYRKADEYWKEIPSTVDGMLGGFPHVSNIDANGSRKFLKSFIQDKTKTTRALDCGAGIGRVSRKLLLPVFDKVDLVELNGDFLAKADTYLAEFRDKVGHKYCCGLQNFQFSEKYDVIWLQWVTGHFIDEDFVKFLQRSKESLNEGGIIVVKDNSCRAKCELDTVDSSVTRTMKDYHRIFERAGLKVVKERRQTDFPDNFLTITMTALAPLQL